jgi:hypothetical protein
MYVAATQARKAAKRTAKKAVKRTTKRTPRKQTTMSASHKSALASGRTESRAVREYLVALDASKPRGRQVSKEDLRARLAQTKKDIIAADRADRLLLVQQRMNLEARLSAPNGADITPLRRAFVKVGKSFAERKSISYHAFREVGVPAAVLAEAGIAR